MFFIIFFIPIVSAITKGINIYGLETPSKDFVCSWKFPVSYYVDKSHELGFNSLRIPFSWEWVQEGNFWKMDELFEAVRKYPDMTIILDMHRVWSSHQGPIPEENGVTLDMFIHNWVIIADRYKDDHQLIGLDVFNEYQGTDSSYWNKILRSIVLKLEENFPNRFIYYVGGIRWGGDIHSINLEDIPFSQRIYYTVHKYIFSGNSVEADWDYSFGNITHKVMVGEWGFKNQIYEQKQWAISFINYLKKRNIRNTYFWTVAHSGDTDGLWFDDCENVNVEKYEIIKTLWT